MTWGLPFAQISYARETIRHKLSALAPHLLVIGPYREFALRV